MHPTVTQEFVKANFAELLRRALLERRYREALAARARQKSRGKVSRVVFAYRLRWKARRQHLARRQGIGNWRADLNRIIVDRL
ncbi:MAG: hypothetical protein IVW57_19680 [Ktedonobacterales bacterium]|nr:hypothetical protein [Ktedonobacterales bacterium]